MTLQLYNTLRRKKEEFRPIVEGKVGMYTCGPTVHDVVHIGNLRAFLTFDLIRRTLEHKGFEVMHVMNITDVDDKIIRGMAREGVGREEYTRKYGELFFRDMDRLGIRKAHVYPAATEHVEQMSELIRRLGEAGLTYEADGSVYFRVAGFPDYGKLSGMGLDKLVAGERVDADEYGKEEVRDFALWKGYVEEDGPVAWETPHGRGRPGWHIECSAMGMAYLGETFDIHAGGVDLIFPHHENEIAQSEGATGKPFVNYWLHNEMLLVEGQKMSKSLGNFTVLGDVLDKGYDKRQIRYAFLQTHYRQPFNFTWRGMEQSAAALRSLDDFRLRLAEAPAGAPTEALDGVIERSEGEFEAALDDDLNSAQAIAAMHTFVNEANRGGFTGGDRERIEALLARMDEVLGILGTSGQGEVSPEAAALIEDRRGAREARDWARSDELRDRLRDLGIEVRDGPEGTTWRRVDRG